MTLAIFQLFVLLSGQPSFGSECRKLLEPAHIIVFSKSEYIDIGDLIQLSDGHQILDFKYLGSHGSSSYFINPKTEEISRIPTAQLWLDGQSLELIPTFMKQNGNSCVATAVINGLHYLSIYGTGLSHNIMNALNNNPQGLLQKIDEAMGVEVAQKRINNYWKQSSSIGIFDIVFKGPPTQALARESFLSLNDVPYERLTFSGDIVQNLKMGNPVILDLPVSTQNQILKNPFGSNLSRLTTVSIPARDGEHDGYHSVLAVGFITGENYIVVIDSREDEPVFWKWKDVKKVLLGAVALKTIASP